MVEIINEDNMSKLTNEDESVTVTLNNEERALKIW